MDVPVEITFECGKTVKNVGVISLALQHHRDICEVPDCLKDVDRELAERSA